MANYNRFVSLCGGGHVGNLRLRKNIEIKYLKVIIEKLRDITARLTITRAGLIVSELTMIDDNGSCSLIEQPCCT